MNRIGIVCIDAVPTNGIQLRMDELKAFVDDIVLFTQYRTTALKSYRGAPLVVGIDSLKAHVAENADAGTVVVNYRQRIRNFDSGRYPDPIKGVWHELHGDGSTAYGMEAFRGVSTILGKTFLMTASDFAGKELRKVGETARIPQTVSENTETTVEEHDAHIPAADMLEDIPPLAVIFLTHNRTATACYCLDTFCKKLRYSGKIHYCICDDRSDSGHVEALVSVLRRNNVSSFSVHYTDDKRWGLGASMNNGLNWAFKFTDVVLTAEDDFVLRQDLDITPCVMELEKPDVCMIKLAAVAVYLNPLSECGHPGFKQCGANRSKPHNQWYTFNNLVALRHKRIFDAIGLYPENCTPAAMEVGMFDRYNKAYDAGFSSQMKILWPTCLSVNTYETEWFVHIGKSTLGHRDTPSVSKFSYLADSVLDKRMRDAARVEARRRFLIVVPTYNSAAFISRCLESIGRQVDRDSCMVAVVDDGSSPEHSMAIIDACSSGGFAVLLPLYENRGAGGARNVAIDRFGDNVEYVMFLDSDDELIGTDAVTRLEDTIDRNGHPDVITLGHRKASGKVCAASKSLYEKMPPAPWTRCIRADTIQRFAENRRMCNDTLQFLRTLDTANTLAAAPGEFVLYHSDNPESGWNNPKTRLSRKAMEGMFETIMDILFSKFERKHTVDEARASARFILSNLTKAITEVCNGKQ